MGYVKRNYDIIIIGSGISGLFTAYTHSLKYPQSRIAILEKGASLAQRHSAQEFSYASQENHAFYGFGGLGKSEGKYNFSADFGGNLKAKIGIEHFLDGIHVLSNTLDFFIGEQPCYSTKDDSLLLKCKQAGLKGLFTSTKHLGKERSYQLLDKMYSFLCERVDIFFHQEALQLEKKEMFTVRTKDVLFISNRVVVATGSHSLKQTQSLLQGVGIFSKTVRLDIGIRVETTMTAFEKVINKVQEFKVAKENDNNEVVAYTYCMNPYGYVIQKKEGSYTFTDGQNYRERGRKSANINFTVFTPFYFESVAQSQAFLEKMMEPIQQLPHKVIMQTLRECRMQIKEGLNEKKQLVHSTQLATAVNLYRYLPSEIIQNTLMMLSKIEEVIEHKLDGNTLLYGVEIKSYSPLIDTDHNFETSIKGLYVVGDGSGETSSLAQAAVSGIYLGKQ